MVRVVLFFSGTQLLFGGLGAAFTVSPRNSHRGRYYKHEFPSITDVAALTTGSTDQTDSHHTNSAEWLRDKLGLPETWKFDSRVDCMLHKVEAAVLEQRWDWLQQQLQLSDQDHMRLITKDPVLLRYDSTSRLEPTLRFLQTRLELTNEQFSKMILNNPNIFYQGIGHNQTMVRTIAWAQNRLGLDTPQLRRLFLRGTRLITMSVETNLETTMNAMQERLGLSDDEMARIFVRDPTVLASNFTMSIGPKLDWYQERLHLTTPQLGKMVQRHPNLLGSSIEKNAEPTIEWLKTRIATEEAVRHIIVVAPQILSLQLSNLAPKFDFLQQQLGESLAGRVISEFPPILGYSLERRIKPRLEEATEAGMVLDLNCIRRIGVYTDEKWAKSIAFQARCQDLEAERARNW